jgi:hypothetical protein
MLLRAPQRSFAMALQESYIIFYFKIGRNTTPWTVVTLLRRLRSRTGKAVGESPPQIVSGSLPADRADLPANFNFSPPKIRVFPISTGNCFF